MKKNFVITEFFFIFVKIMDMIHLKIDKLYSKTTELYFYKKVYFTIGGRKFMRKQFQYRMIDKKSKVHFYREEVTFRADQLSGNLKRDYIKINLDKYYIKQFEEEFKKYKFKIRKDKFKRLIENK